MRDRCIQFLNPLIPEFLNRGSLHMKNRVVITSIGLVSALGFSTEKALGGLESGGAAFERAAFDDNVCVCPVGMDFRLKDFIGRYKNARYLNRGAQFCVASATAALRNSGLDEEMLAGTGLFVGSGPNLDIGGEFPEILEGNLDRETLAALWILKFLPNTAASAISDLAGVHGENATVGTACSASLQALGEGFRKIRSGYLDIALAGGGDSRLSPGAILAYRKAQALWTGRGDPSTQYGPFDRNRRGFIPGEGGAFFVLENLELARARSAVILGEVCGFGASMDGYNMTAPDPAGRWAEVAVRSALDEAGLGADRIDVISAHGTATPLNDEMEAALIGRIFGSKPPVVALKSRIGHLAAACGAVELALGLACLHRGFLPGIRNLKDPAFDKINLVRESQSTSAETMIVENFGFGGQNAALVVKKWKE
jgi:3-oxoacyl-[acyl-carrier-protein] synthase II